MRLHGLYPGQQGAEGTARPSALPLARTRLALRRGLRRKLTWGLASSTLGAAPAPSLGCWTRKGAPDPKDSTTLPLRGMATPPHRRPRPAHPADRPAGTVTTAPPGTTTPPRAQHDHASEGCGHAPENTATPPGPTAQPHPWGQRHLNSCPLRARLLAGTEFSPKNIPRAGCFLRTADTVHRGLTVE